jgi:Rrf2 family protein
MRLELTQRGAYAVRASITLARVSDGGLLPSSAIAREMRIPPRFLPQVMADLVRAGIVEAQVGRRGGYRLARPAATLSLLEVIEAVEGEARRKTCVIRGSPCGDGVRCDVHAVFEAAQDALLAELSGTSIAEAAAAHRVSA